MASLINWLTTHGAQLSPKQRATHVHVIGQPGTGKSRALESWVMQDIKAGHGVGVIDPAGDLYQNLVARISRLVIDKPQLAERVILIDPSHAKWTVGFNPLEGIAGIPPERLALFFTDVIINIWRIDVASAPRMMLLLNYSFLMLAEQKLTLVSLPRFLTDASWRESLIEKSKHFELVQYFRYEFPTGKSEIHQWITPVLNKIRPLIFDPDVRLMLAAGSTINFRRILDRQAIFLVNLSKGTLGESNSAILGAFLVAHLQQAAFSRANSEYRPPFYLYVDEFQNYTTGNIKDILAESRKYGLSLTLAHQYLHQLSEDLRYAVLNTAGTIACFRVGYQDAASLAREIFPPGAVRNHRLKVDITQVRRVPIPDFREEHESMSQEQETALLTQLRPREFWVKQRGKSHPKKQRTLDMPLPPRSQMLAEAHKQLTDTSGNLYGRLKNLVREEMIRDRGDPGNYTTTEYE